VIGNDHARFWIGGGGSNPFADHTGFRSMSAPIMTWSSSALTAAHVRQNRKRAIILMSGKS
jgi:hypothetical protein